MAKYVQCNHIDKLRSECLRQFCSSFGTHDMVQDLADLNVHLVFLDIVNATILFLEMSKWRFEELLVILLLISKNSSREAKLPLVVVSLIQVIKHFWPIVIFSCFRSHFLVLFRHLFGFSFVDYFSCLLLGFLWNVLSEYRSFVTLVVLMLNLNYLLIRLFSLFKYTVVIIIVLFWPFCQFVAFRWLVQDLVILSHVFIEVKNAFYWSFSI